MGRRLLRHVERRLRQSKPSCRLPLRRLVRGVTDAPRPCLQRQERMGIRPITGIVTTKMLGAIATPVPLVILRSGSIRLGLLHGFSTSRRHGAQSSGTTSRVLNAFNKIAVRSFPK